MKRVLSIIALAALAACGGGGGAPPVQSGTQGGGTSSLAITVSIPGKSAAAVHHVRRPLYTSIDTKGIGIEYKTAGTPYSGAPSSSPAFAQAIAAGATGCTNAATDGSFSCTIYIPSITAGYHDIRVALWNDGPTGCVSPNQTGCAFTATQDRVLSFSVLSNYAIVSGLSNTLNLTLLPVVDSMSVALNGSISDGAASTATAYLTLKDAHGDIILGSDQLVDANGDDLTVALSIAGDVNDSGAACGSQVGSGGGCSLYFASNPSWNTAGISGNSVTVNYDGGYAFPSSGSQVPSVSASLSAGGPIGGTTLGTKFLVTGTLASVTIPGAPQYKVASQAFGSAPTFSALGSDKNLYVVAGGGIEYFTPCSAPGPCPLTNVTTIAGTPGGVAAGVDNQLWYTDNTHHTVVHQPVGSNGTAVSSASLGHALGQIAAGPDGNMWFVDVTLGNLDSISPSGMTITPYSTGSLPITGALAAGTFANGDQAVCGGSWGNGPGSYMACVNVSNGHSFSAPALGGDSSTTANGLTFGADGLLYVAQYNSTTTTGSITSWYADPVTHAITESQTYVLPAGEDPQGIVAGSDGSIWFTVSGGSAGNVLGRIQLLSTGDPPPTKGQLEEWTSTNGVQLPSSAAPGWLSVDSAGHLWISDSSANKTVDEVAP